MMIIFVTMRRTLFELGFYAFTKDVKINELKHGMIAADAVKLIKGKYYKEKIGIMGAYSSAKTSSYKVFEPRPEGLFKDEIRKLKTLQKNKMLKFQSIRIYETLPFAPFMFAGAVLVLIFSVNL